MNIKEFSVSVSHSQIAVFDHAFERPFNMWTTGHVAQGFSWRPGSVAFRTVEESGRHLVIVEVNRGGVDLAPSAVRIIEVPFEVPDDDTIEIGSISESAVVHLPSGPYQLRYECCESGGTSNPRIHLSFWKDASPHFAIIRADDALNPGSDLIKVAEPA
jgi:Competence protein J (ComJ)